MPPSLTIIAFLAPMPVVVVSIRCANAAGSHENAIFSVLPTPPPMPLTVAPVLVAGVIKLSGRRVKVIITGSGGRQNGGRSAAAAGTAQITGS